MPKSPDKPNHSAESNEGYSLGLKFRLVLAFILGMGVGATIIKWRSEHAKPNKPDITDVTYQRDGGTDNPPKPKKTASSLPVRPSLPTNGHELMCQPVSDEEIENRAHQLETEKRQKIAEEIIKRFCISDERDKDKITNAVLKGFIELHDKGLYQSSKSGKWRIELKTEKLDRNSDLIDMFLNIQDITLEKEPPDECKPALSKEEIEQKQKEKKMIKDLKDGKTAQYLNQFDSEKILNEARSLGIENEDIIKEFLKAIEKAKETMRSDLDGNARKKLACELQLSMMRMEYFDEGINPEVDKKLKTNTNLPFDEFVNFVEAYSKAQGINDDSDECVLFLEISNK